MNPFDELTLKQKLAAMEKRTSVRAYEDGHLSEGQLTAIRACIESINEAAEDFELQLLGPFEDACEACGVMRKMFSGKWHWTVAISCSSNPDVRERMGYEVEKLVLLLVDLGLASCWIAGTYDADAVSGMLAGDGGNPLFGILPVGFEKKPVPLKQRTIRAGIRARGKKPQTVLKGSTQFDELPQWAQAGIEAVLEGPSAVNQQPVRFEWNDGVLSASYEFEKPRHQDVDFGIAKLHFHIAAGEIGHWEWGQNSAYVVSGSNPDL